MKCAKVDTVFIIYIFEKQSRACFGGLVVVQCVPCINGMGLIHI